MDGPNWWNEICWKPSSRTCYHICISERERDDALNSALEAVSELFYVYSEDGKAYHNQTWQWFMAINRAKGVTFPASSLMTWRTFDVHSVCPAWLLCMWEDYHPASSSPVFVSEPRTVDLRPVPSINRTNGASRGPGQLEAECYCS